MFHTHKWTKWRLVTLFVTYANGRSGDTEALERDCPKCGKIQRKALRW